MDMLQIEDAVATRVFATVRYTNSQIVTEEYQNRLMFWRDTFRIGQFDIGDIANEIIVDCASRGIAVNNDRIDEAVGSFCGKAGRTVRYYRETAAFFTVDIRERYNMLSFSHFVFARTLRWMWEVVLDYAAASPNITVRGLHLHFIDKSPGGNALSAGTGSPTYAKHEQETPMDDPAGEKIYSEISPDSPLSYSAQAKIRAISAFTSSLGGVRTLVKASQARTETRNRVLDALDTLERDMPEILSVL